MKIMVLLIIILLATGRLVIGTPTTVRSNGSTSALSYKGFESNTTEYNFSTNYASFRNKSISNVSVGSSNAFKTNQLRLPVANPCPSFCRCYAAVIAQCGPSNTTVFPCDVPIESRSAGPRYKNVFSLSTRNIYLSSNEIETIPENCLIVSGSNVLFLDLRNNSISRIEPDAFKGLTQLQNLDLSNNRISSITLKITSINFTVSVFRNLSDTLINLQLSNNSIRRIPNNAFSGFRQLQVLSLSFNQISYISRRAFEELHNLRILYLRGNGLTSATASRINVVLSWFTNDQDLYEKESVSSSGLSCSDSISGLGRDIALRKKRHVQFRSQTNRLRSLRHSDSIIKKRSVNSRNLQTVDLGALRLNEVPFCLARSIKILYLDRNSIAVLRRNSFSCSSNLELLYLSHNRLHYIEDGALANLQQLVLLDLSNNNIAQLSPNTFCGLTALQSLRLFRNKNLTQLPSKIFKHTAALQLLYLQDCGFQTLPQGPWIHRLRGLWLYGNPLHCDCDSVAPLLVSLRYQQTAFPIKLQLDSQKISFDDRDVWPYLRSDDTKCFSPPHYENYSVKNIRFRDLRCSVTKWSELIMNKRLASRRNSLAAYGSLSHSGESTAASPTEKNPNETYGKREVKNVTRHVLDDDMNNMKNTIAFGNNGTEDEEMEDTYDYLRSFRFSFEDEISFGNDNIFNLSLEQELSPTENVTSGVKIDEEAEELQLLTDRTEWFIELPSKPEVISVYESPQTDDVTDSPTQPSENNSITSFRDHSSAISEEAGGNETFSSSSLKDYDSEYTIIGEDSYYSPDLSTGDLEEYIYRGEYHQSRYDDYVGFENDYRNWLREEQITELKESLKDIDLSQAYAAYYDDDPVSGPDYDVLSSLYNETVNTIGEGYDN